MNKVITINLDGNAYPLEENGYEALRAYLATAARRLESNPDRDEIISDIEQAIAEKVRAALPPHKTVVPTKAVEQIIAEMGPVEDGSNPGEEATAAAEPAEAGPPKRLYKIHEGAVLGGVCNGLAAFLAIDVRFVRVLFAILALVTLGAGAVLYLVLALVLPAAKTPAEKAAAHGSPATTEEFIRRAREGYYEGMKSFNNKQAHRAWRRKFRHEMRGWKRNFRAEMRARWARGDEAPATAAGPWSARERFHPAALVALPVLSVAAWVIGLFGLGAAFSLLTTGAVWGWPLPHGTPLWIGLVFLFVSYHILVWPLKTLRYFFFFRGPRGGDWTLPRAPGDSFAGLALLALLLWLGNRYVPAVHQGLQLLPPVAHHLLDSLRRWWDRR